MQRCYHDPVPLPVRALSLGITVKAHIIQVFVTDDTVFDAANPLQNSESAYTLKQN